MSPGQFASTHAVHVNNIEVSSLRFENPLRLNDNEIPYVVSTFVIPRALASQRRIDIRLSANRIFRVNEVDFRSQDHRSLGLGVLAFSMNFASRLSTTAAVYAFNNDVRRATRHNGALLPALLGSPVRPSYPPGWIFPWESVASRLVKRGGPVSPYFFELSENRVQFSGGLGSLNFAEPSASVKLLLTAMSQFPINTTIVIFVNGECVYEEESSISSPTIVEFDVPIRAFASRDPADLTVRLNPAGRKSSTNDVVKLVGMSVVDLMPTNALLALRAGDFLHMNDEESGSLLSGCWYSRETGGRWTVASLGEISFDLFFEDFLSLEVSLEVAALVSTSVRNAITISVNGEPIESVSFHGSVGELVRLPTIKFSLDREKGLPARRIKLGLARSERTVPALLNGATDSRDLGVFVFSVHVDNNQAQVLRSGFEPDRQVADIAYHESSFTSSIRGRIFVDLTNVSVQNDIATGAQRFLWFLLSLFDDPGYRQKVFPVVRSDKGWQSSSLAGGLLKSLGVESSSFECDFNAGDILMVSDLDRGLEGEALASLAKLKEAGVQILAVTSDLSELFRNVNVLDIQASALQAWLNRMMDVGEFLFLGADIFYDAMLVLSAAQDTGDVSQLCQRSFIIEVSRPLLSHKDLDPIELDAIHWADDRKTILVIGSEARYLDIELIRSTFVKLIVDFPLAQLLFVGKDFVTEHGVQQLCYEYPESVMVLESVSLEGYMSIARKISCGFATSNYHTYNLPFFELLPASIPVVVLNGSPIHAETHVELRFGRRAPAELASMLRDALSSAEAGLIVAPFEGRSISGSQAVNLALMPEAIIAASVLGPVIYVFSAMSPSVRSQVGERFLSTIESTGKAGLLLHGPFFSLRPGRYSAQVYAKIEDLERDTCKIEILARGGAYLIKSASPDVSEFGLSRFEMVCRTIF